MIKILIVDDCSETRSMLKLTLANCGYYIDLTIVDSYESAMGYLGEKFHIVAADWFLEPTKTSAETGFQFLKKYHGRHGDFRLVEDDLCLIAYSGSPQLIPVNQGIYVIDKNILVETLLDYIKKFAIKQGKKIQHQDQGEIFMEQCRDHVEIKENISAMRTDVIEIKEALLGTFDEPGGLVTSVKTLVLWKDEREAEMKKVTAKMWGFAGGTIVGAAAAVIGIFQLLKQ